MGRLGLKGIMGISLKDKPKSNSEYLVRNPVQATLRLYITPEADNFLICFAWQDPDTLHELILNLFKVNSWTTNGWKTLRFWWYFYTFMKLQWETCLRLGYKHKHKLFWMVSHHVWLNKYRQRWDFFFFFLDYHGNFVSKVWCKWSVGNSMFEFWIEK